MYSEKSQHPADQEENRSVEEEKDNEQPENISFNEKRHALLLDINKGAVDLDDIEVRAWNNGFEEKDEFHITVIGNRNAGEIKKLLKRMSEEGRAEILSKIKSLIESTDWGFVIEPRRYHITKDYKSPAPGNKNEELKEHRESYVQMVSVPGLKRFYEELSALIGANLETQPAHITLYTKGSDMEKAKMGIGINSQADFEKLNPEEI
jgi:hypothetical protein